MNNNMNEELKIRFIRHILCIGGRYGLLDWDYYLERKEFIDSLIEDFCNLNIKSIANLTETETCLFRQIFGLLDFGCIATYEDISNTMSLSSARIERINKQISLKLRLYLRDVTALKEFKNSLINNDISSLLDTNFLYIIDDISIFNELRCAGFKTIRQIISKTSKDLLKIKKIGVTRLDKLNKYLRRYNLSLADDIAVSEKNINKYDIMKALIYKFDVDEKYYKLIKQMVDELYDLRNDQVLSLSTRETFIIRKMCGILDGGVKQSLTEIGKYLGYSIVGRSNCVKFAFDSLHAYFKTYVYNETMKLSKDEMLKMDLKYFNIYEESYINLRQRNICTLDDLMHYKEIEDASTSYIYYIRSLLQCSLDLVEQKGLTLEELAEKERIEKEAKEEEERQEQERLERIALNEKRKNELLQARSVLLAQKEELAKRMNYYNGEVEKVEEKIRKLEIK